jgi:hypothetical protein
MCDQCEISEKIAEQQAERRMQTENQHWQIVDLRVGRSYLGSKSFATKEEATLVLEDMLKYHANTEWIERLSVVPGCQLAQKVALYNDNRRTNGRPKGCKGRSIKNRFKARGIEYGLKMEFK